MKKLLALFLALVAYVGIAFAAVNINSATKEQLESLDGIGPVKAQAIIDYRKKNGPFKSLEDLKKVDGIGDATVLIDHWRWVTDPLAALTGTNIAK